MSMSCRTQQFWCSFSSKTYCLSIEWIWNKGQRLRPPKHMHIAHIMPIAIAFKSNFTKSKCWNCILVVQSIIFCHMQTSFEIELDRWMNEWKFVCLCPCPNDIDDNYGFRHIDKSNDDGENKNIPNMKWCKMYERNQCKSVRLPVCLSVYLPIYLFLCGTIILIAH